MRLPCREGSRRQRAGKGGKGEGELIKLVQLLIRWKAFNLDNLLTTWPTHYTFPISDNPQQGKKHSPIPCRRLDTVPSFCPSCATTSLLQLSHRPIIKSFKVAVHLVHHHHAWWSRSIRTYRCIDTWKKLVSYIQVSVYPSEYRRSIFGGDRRGRSSKRGSETKGERTVARSVFSLPVELYLHGVTCPINREHYSPVDGLRIRDGARITPGYIYTRVRI